MTRVACCLVAAFSMLWGHAAAAECPAVLTDALRLALVTTRGMEPGPAQLRRFTRKSPADPWVQVGAMEPAVVGVAGLAWGHTFDHLKLGKEPIKVEGDKRTPAGIFRLGPTFGFKPAPFRGHRVLERDKSLCVDDPGSKFYNTIGTKAEVGKVASAERMWEIGLYRVGLLVDYPTDRRNRRGSCIFVHVWRSPAHGTAGCIALPEARVVALQRFAEPGAVLAVLPADALKRLSGCLPEPVDRGPKALDPKLRAAISKAMARRKAVTGGSGEKGN